MGADLWIYPYKHRMPADWQGERDKGESSPFIVPGFRIHLCLPDRLGIVINYHVAVLIWVVPEGKYLHWTIRLRRSAGQPGV